MGAVAALGVGGVVAAGAEGLELGAVGADAAGVEGFELCAIAGSVKTARAALMAIHLIWLFMDSLSSSNAGFILPDLRDC